jgi:endoglucanase
MQFTHQSASWDAYWEFCSGFGAYDPTGKEWRKPLLDALKTPSK